MWERLKSDGEGPLGSGKEREALFLSLFAFLSVLPFLLLLYLLEPGGYFSYSFFLLGTGAELLLSLLGSFLRKRDRRGGILWNRLEYLIRVVVGLPMTIYLLQTATYPYPGFLRHLILVWLVARRLGIGEALWYCGFYLSGHLLFSLVSGGFVPEIRDLFVAPVLFLTSLFPVAAALFLRKRRGENLRNRRLIRRLKREASRG